MQFWRRNWLPFTDEARQSMIFAQHEAYALGTNIVEPEHLLLGLLHEDNSHVARLLARVGVPLATLREQSRRAISCGAGIRDQRMAPSPALNAIFDAAHAEATAASHRYIGTEHLLLGFLNRPDSLAGQIVCRAGIDGEAVRSLVAAGRAIPPKTATGLRALMALRLRRGARRP